MTRFLLLAALALTVTNAQFTCTLTNQDEDSCLKMIGDDSEHCVWCNLASFGFCVGEQQAEQMEQSLPGVACDRFSGTDDAAPATDDATPATDDATPKTDDATPKTDDATPPSDDSLPDDFWTCLQKKDSKSCLAASCTWCDSNEYKFGVCMTGPTADSASDSTFFTCTAASNSNVDVVASDPSDPSCLTAYLQDPTQEGCTAAVDAQGNPCEWCSLADMANLCLTAEQADLANPLGITCQDEQESSSSIVTSLLRGVGLKSAVQDPLDTACLLAFLQDPTETGCKAAVDSDGNACEFCDLQGQYQLCLNEEQAGFGEQVGMDCGAAAKEEVADPMDPGCLLAYLQDPTEAGCKAAVDSDGNACEFCSLQGQYQLCLNEEQAMYGAQMGMDCSFAHQVDNKIEDPLDTACLLAFLQDPTEEGCHAAIDSDGNACEFCTLQGQYQLCLNEEQAMYGEQIGMECSEQEISSSKNFVDAFLAEEANLLATAEE